MILSVCVFVRTLKPKRLKLKLEDVHSIERITHAGHSIAVCIFDSVTLTF